MKRLGILCGVGGLLLVLGVVYLRSADAQSGTVPLPSSISPVPTTAEILTTLGVSPPQPSPAPAEQKKADNIYELLTRLASIKAKKAELDKAENETMTLLKKELSQLKQQSKKLGVISEDEGVNQAPTETAPPPMLPTHPPSPRPR